MYLLIQQYKRLSFILLFFLCVLLYMANIIITCLISIYTHFIVVFAMRVYTFYTINLSHNIGSG